MSRISRFYEKKRHTKLIDILDAIKKFNLLNKDIPVRDSMEKRINNQITNLAINDKRIDSIRLDFVSRHCAYQIAPDLLYLLLEREAFDADTIKYYYNDIPEETKEGLMGKLLSKKIEQEENKKKSLVGCIAPDLEGKVLARWEHLNNEQMSVLDSIFR